MPYIFSMLLVVLSNPFGVRDLKATTFGVLADENAIDFSGEGEYEIKNNTLILHGDAPRFRIMHDYENVNVTFYATRIAEEKELDYQGFVVGVRSQHYDDDMCGANTYYARLTYDGKVSFEKELFHGEGSNAFFGDKVVLPDGVPFNKAVGFQFQALTLPSGNVKLTLLLDLPGNGEWRKVLEYTDNGGWPVTIGQDEIDKRCEGYYPINKIITTPGFTFIRNDGLGEDGASEYRNITIEEMN